MWQMEQDSLYSFVLTPLAQRSLFYMADGAYKSIILTPYSLLQPQTSAASPRIEQWHHARISKGCDESSAEAPLHPNAS